MIGSHEPQATWPVASPTGLQNNPPIVWSLPHRVLFRWVFCYFLFYTLPSRGRVCLIPWEQPFLAVWQPIVQWVAVHAFGISGPAATFFQTGSGDTTLDYIENYCYIVMAFVGAIVWSIVDRNRPNYVTLNCWFRIWVRYTLAMTMLVYGFAKVFPMQMHLSVPYLLHRWGDSSPMGVLWNFMAASVPYTIWCGSAEALGGTLLLFRRTALLGAVVSLGVMVNVAALNYCYDVPVKLYSTNLVFMSAFVIGPDWRRLLGVLLFHRAVSPANLAYPGLLSRWWMRIPAWLIKGVIVYFVIVPSWEAYKQFFLTPSTAPLSGLFEVEGLTRNGKEEVRTFPESELWHIEGKNGAAAINRPTVLGDFEKWRWLYFQGTNSLTVTSMSERRQRYDVQQDNAKQTLTISGDKDTNVLTFTWAGTNQLLLRASITNALELRLHPIPASEFLLVNRGFHWINEYPFNR